MGIGGSPFLHPEFVTLTCFRGKGWSLSHVKHTAICVSWVTDWTLSPSGWLHVVQYLLLTIVFVFCIPFYRLINASLRHLCTHCVQSWGSVSVCECSGGTSTLTREHCSACSLCTGKHPPLCLKFLDVKDKDKYTRTPLKKQACTTIHCHLYPRPVPATMSLRA